MDTTKMTRLLKLIAESADPETMPGAHLTAKGRAALAFASLANFRKQAKDILADEPFNVGAYLDQHS